MGNSCKSLPTRSENSKADVASASFLRKQKLVKQTPTLATLPTELNLQIYGYLKDDFVSQTCLALACKPFYNILKTANPGAIDLMTSTIVEATVEGQACTNLEGEVKFHR